MKAPVELRLSAKYVAPWFSYPVGTEFYCFKHLIFLHCPEYYHVQNAAFALLKHYYYSRTCVCVLQSITLSTSILFSPIYSQAFIQIVLSDIPNQRIFLGSNMTRALKYNN